MHLKFFYLSIASSIPFASADVDAFQHALYQREAPADAYAHTFYERDVDAFVQGRVVVIRVNSKPLTSHSREPALRRRGSAHSTPRGGHTSLDDSASLDDDSTLVGDSASLHDRLEAILAEGRPGAEDASPAAPKSPPPPPAPKSPPPPPAPKSPPPQLPAWANPAPARGVYPPDAFWTLQDGSGVRTGPLSHRKFSLLAHFWLRNFDRWRDYRVVMQAILAKGRPGAEDASAAATLELLPDWANPAPARGVYPPDTFWTLQDGSGVRTGPLLLLAFSQLAQFWLDNSDIWRDYRVEMHFKRVSEDIRPPNYDLETAIGTYIYEETGLLMEQILIRGLSNEQVDGFLGHFNSEKTKKLGISSLVDFTMSVIKNENENEYKLLFTVEARIKGRSTYKDLASMDVNRIRHLVRKWKAEVLGAHSS